MDAEQLKKLKPGDSVMIRGVFRKIKENGDAQVTYPLTTHFGTDYVYRAAVKAEALAPDASHAKNRLFRKGDKVRVVARDGRSWWQLDPHTTISQDEIYTVLEDEEEIIAGGYGELRIEGGGHEYEIPFYFLELITPVKELEPYRVELLQDGLPPDTHHFWAVMDKTGQEVARFWCEQYEEGKAEDAAEAERDRLNAKSRKERGYDA